MFFRFLVHKIYRSADTQPYDDDGVESATTDDNTSQADLDIRAAVLEMFE